MAAQAVLKFVSETTSMTHQGTKVRQDIPECCDPKYSRVPSLLILKETFVRHIQGVRHCARNLKLWKLEQSPCLMELTFKRAKGIK